MMAAEKKGNTNRQAANHKTIPKLQYASIVIKDLEIKLDDRKVTRSAGGILTLAVLAAVGGISLLAGISR